MNIVQMLKGIENELDFYNELDFNLLDDKNELNEEKTIVLFSELFKQHGFNPLISIYFLLFLQIIKNDAHYKQFEHYDIKGLYIKLNEFIIRLSENVEDCLYYLETSNSTRDEINIQKQKLEQLINIINTKILEFEKWNEG